LSLLSSCEYIGKNCDRNNDFNFWPSCHPSEVKVDSAGRVHYFAEEGWAAFNDQFGLLMDFESLLFVYMCTYVILLMIGSKYFQRNNVFIYMFEYRQLFRSLYITITSVMYEKCVASKKCTIIKYLRKYVRMYHHNVFTTFKFYSNKFLLKSLLRTSNYTGISAEFRPTNLRNLYLGVFDRNFKG